VKTILYFSGQNLEIEDYMRDHQEIFSSCGILLSYNDLKKDGGSNRTRRRFRRLIRKNREEK
jgi:hypothetical protein